MTDLTLQHRTVSLSPVDPHRLAVFRACQEATELPWYAFKRRAGWIGTAKHIKRLYEIGESDER